MHGKRWSAGFSLVELLLAVAILATLAGFGFVSVVQQRKNLAIMEADETAKEIFLAAQEHLSMAALQGRLSASKYSENDLLNFTITDVDLGVKVNGNDENPDTYAIFNERNALAASVDASDIMLPQGAVDAYVLNHRYAVRYNDKAYKVLEVFYTEDLNYAFKHEEGEPWREIQTWLDGEREVLENPGNFRVGEVPKSAIMGWYGEDALFYRLGSGDSLEGLNLDKPPQAIRPGLTLVNGPVLYALVTLQTNYAYSDVTLNIEGVDGGLANLSFECDPVTDTFSPKPGATGRVFPLNVNNPDDEDTVTYIVILDDVTVDGLDFASLPFDGERIKAGSDINVTVEATGQQRTKDENGLSVLNPTILTGTSNTVTRNSLFAEASSPTDAHIKNFRHLQNLSKLNADNGPVTATLEQDICWTSHDPDNLTQNPFKETVDIIHNSYSNALTPGSVSYTPVNLAYDMTFDGGSHTISDLEIDRNDIANAGVFGTLNGNNTIRNLKLDNTAVTTTSAVKSGALVGYSNGTLTVDNVESSSNASIQAADYAGGLIGHAEGSVNVTNARTHISSGGSVTATSADGAAGGLIGGASGNVEINYSASYSRDFAKIKDGSPDNGEPGSVTATGSNGVAGGLVGTIEGTSGSSKIEGCAAANLVEATGANSIAGGLVGKAGGDVDVSRSYAGGITDGGEYETAGGTLNGNVSGAYAGGLLGRVDGTDVTLEKVYSTASVYGSAQADNLYTESTPNGVTVDTASYGAGDSQTGNGSIQPGDKPEYLTNPTTGSRPYDNGLLNNGSAPNYPYDSVRDMDPALKDSSYDKYEWITHHVGDWPTSPIQPGIDLYNDEVLYAEIHLDECDYSNVDLEITGPGGTSTKIHFPFNPETGKFVENDPANKRVFPKTDEHGAPVKDADDKIIYIVILDDVTVPGLGFGDIEIEDPNNPGTFIRNPIPMGSDITATIKATTRDGRTGNDSDNCNSLFADGSSPTDAHIENFRHLQNLSNLNPDSGTEVTATLDNNLNWDTAFDNVNDVRELYTNTPPSYTPVNTNYDLDFNGGGNTISHLDITNADKNHNAGVFGTLGGDTSIDKLKLEDITVDADDADRAGALVGSSSRGLTVTNVQSSVDTITAREYAGGLIGYASGEVSVISSASYSEDFATAGEDGTPGHVTATSKDGVAGGLIGGLKDGENAKVIGCAASNIVEAQGSEGTARGLIGEASGKVDVALSYAGGVTTDGSTPNVQGAQAGGLVGKADGTDVTLTSVYSTATAHGTGGTGSTGSICPGSSATVSDAYGADNPQPSDTPVTGKPYDKELLDTENPTDPAPDYPYRNIVDSWKISRTAAQSRRGCLPAGFRRTARLPLRTFPTGYSTTSATGPTMSRWHSAICSPTPTTAPSARRDRIPIPTAPPNGTESRISSRPCGIISPSPCRSCNAT